MKLYDEYEKKRAELLAYFGIDETESKFEIVDIFFAEDAFWKESGNKIEWKDKDWDFYSSFSLPLIRRRKDYTLVYECANSRAGNSEVNAWIFDNLKRKV